jgi:hypothetical protein
MDLLSTAAWNGLTKLKGGCAMKRNLRKLHRWLGLVFSISVLMSAGSGVLHNIMTRTQSPPPPARPVGGGLDASRIRLSVAEAEERLKEKIRSLQPNALTLNTHLLAANVRSIHGNPWYQLFLQSMPVPYYVNANTGDVDTAQDEVYARQIASEFLGEAPVSKTDYLEKFNAEYINIFRILPVFRYDAADGKGTRVYVSTVTGSVTRYTDNERQREANIFSNFHKLMFIHNKNLRDLVLTIATGGVFCLAIVGIGLFFLTMPKKGES